MSEILRQPTYTEGEQSPHARGIRAGRCLHAAAALEAIESGTDNPVRVYRSVGEAFDALDSSKGTPEMRLHVARLAMEGSEQSAGINPPVAVESNGAVLAAA